MIVAVDAAPVQVPAAAAAPNLGAVDPGFGALLALMADIPATDHAESAEAPSDAEPTPALDLIALLTPPAPAEIMPEAAVDLVAGNVEAADDADAGETVLLAVAMPTVLSVAVAVPGDIALDADRLRPEPARHRPDRMPKAAEPAFGADFTPDRIDAGSGGEAPVRTRTPAPAASAAAPPPPVAAPLARDVASPREAPLPGPAAAPPMAPAVLPPPHAAAPVAVSAAGPASPVPVAAAAEAAAPTLAVRPARAASPDKVRPEPAAAALVLPAVFATPAPTTAATLATPLPAAVLPPPLPPEPTPRLAATVTDGSFDVATDRLGAVNVRLDAAETRFAVHFTVDRSVSAALLGAHGDRLEAAVAAQGARLDGLSVDIRGGGGDRRPPAPAAPSTPVVQLRLTPTAAARPRDRYA